MLDTLRHEVAHVLAGNMAGHGFAWRQAARSLGAVPEARVTLNKVGLQNHLTYKAVCPVCGKVFLSATRRRNRACSCIRGQNLPLSEIHRRHLTYKKVEDESELLNV